MILSSQGRIAMLGGGKEGGVFIGLKKEMIVRAERKAGKKK